ncbi:ribonuclease domain-containing protein [Candidatus Arsenophonus nilaparvatae]|uniref:ribonuclease domain-containing protein n=1 Tax=Candidatus Arsenophonus nilaparvatae TaxID=1247023 RepID=UPI0005094132|nr:ribonuclease domain-containing protein [Candidatus Arsenophonus nilaparvatae]
MNKKIVILLILAILIGAGVYFKWHSRQQADIIGQTVAPTVVHNIDKLTAQQNVVNYLRQYHRLPDFYITKRKARQSGWDPRAGNLCQVVPGKAIGGDRYNNREKLLPAAPDRQWYEADINYHCGHRASDRLLYSSDGLIYVTLDHYKTFSRVN